MIKTNDATTTDRLRRSPLDIDWSPSYARKRACMELTIICRFQRLLASTRLFAQSPFYGFSVPSPLACSQCVDTLLFASKHAKGMPLRYDSN